MIDDLGQLVRTAVGPKSDSETDLHSCLLGRRCYSTSQHDVGAVCAEGVPLVRGTPVYSGLGGTASAIPIRFVAPMNAAIDSASKMR